VDQVEVDVLQTEPSPALLEAGQRLRPAVVGAGQLGGDDDLLARHVGVRDGAADTHLVVVARGAVDQPVATFQRRADGGVGLVVVERICAQAETGDRPPVQQLDRRRGRHNCFLPTLARIDA
jgi:hypothetical protein